jgi:hypothetical protein
LRGSGKYLKIVGKSRENVGQKIHHSLRYGLADSLLQRFSGFLTDSQCLLGPQGPS